MRRAILLVAGAAVAFQFPSIDVEPAAASLNFSFKGPFAIAQADLPNSVALFVNNAGDVAGTWNNGGRGFRGTLSGLTTLIEGQGASEVPIDLAQDGTILTRDLILPKSGPPVSVASIATGALATSLNDRGQIAGSWVGAGRTRAMIWAPASGFVDIGLVGGNSAVAKVISDSGFVAGERTALTGRTRVFVWSPTTGARVLPSLGSQGNTTVAAINDSGAVAGTSMTNSGQRHAFYWDPIRGMVDLGSLGDGFTEAVAMNSRGQIAGFGPQWIGGPQYAFTWSDATGLVGLGGHGGPDSTPTGINEHGQVSGHATDRLMRVNGWLAQPEHGIPRLDSTGASAPSRALALNDRGDIVGSARIDGVEIAVRWKVPTHGIAMASDRSPITTLPAGARPEQSELIDVDQNGEIDLVTLDVPNSRVILMHGQGSGRFERWLELSVDEQSIAMTTGDVNGDDRIDVATISAVANRFVVHVQQSNGLFDRFVGPIVGLAPVDIKFVDFDRDGRDDVLAATGTTVYTYRSVPPVGFALADSRALEIDPIAEILVASDNEEGLLTAVAVGTDPEVQSWQVAIDGTVSVPYEAVFSRDGGTEPVWTLGDVTADGLVDITVATRDGANATKISVLRGLGGRFGWGEPEPTVVPIATAHTILTVDLDRDTDLDLVATVAGTAPGRTRILTASGWTASPFFGTSSSDIAEDVSDVDATDLDGDGDADLLLTLRVPGAISVLWNETVPSIQVHWSAAEYARIQELMAHYGMNYDELTKFGVYAAAFVNAMTPTANPTPVTVAAPGTAQTQTITWYPNDIELLEAVKHRWVLDDEGGHRWGYMILNYFAILQGA